MRPPSRSRRDAAQPLPRSDDPLTYGRRARRAGVGPETVADVEQRKSVVRRVLDELGETGAAGMALGGIPPPTPAEPRPPRSDELRLFIREAIETAAATGPVVIGAHAASFALAGSAAAKRSSTSRWRPFAAICGQYRLGASRAIVVLCRASFATTTRISRRRPLRNLKVIRSPTVPTRCYEWRYASPANGEAPIREVRRDISTASDRGIGGGRTREWLQQQLRFITSGAPKRADREVRSDEPTASRGGCKASRGGFKAREACPQNRKRPAEVEHRAGHSACERSRARGRRRHGSDRSRMRPLASRRLSHPAQHSGRPFYRRAPP